MIESVSLLIGRISTYKKDDEMTWSRIIWRQDLNLWIQSREVDNVMTGKDEPKKGLVLLKISKGILRDIFKLNVDR